MRIIVRIGVTVLGAATVASAGGTSRWTARSEADFSRGAFSNVVVDSLGELRLARALHTLLEQSPRIAAVYCLAEGPDGTIYAGTGPNGIILAIRNDTVQTFATLEDRNIFSIMVARDGRLLAGTGGARGRVLRVAGGGKPVEMFSAGGVQYVWQMQQTPDGNIYLATGPEGQVFEITPDGRSAVLFDSDENNILSLVSDGGDMLYAGSDPNGLVYRINRRTKEVFVALDAAESEITALALDAAGNLYAATGQAPETEDGGGEEPPAAEKSGRPEGAESAAPLPSKKPPAPKPPAPVPPGADPDAIPRKMAAMPATGAAEPPLPAPEPPAGPAVQPAARTRPQPAMPPGRPRGAGPVPPGGNAIYRIDQRGFVTEVFRQQVMVLSMAEKNGMLIVGTGSEGLVYEVNPSTAEAAVLARPDPKHVMAVLPARNGRVMLGLANAGGVAAMSEGYAARGTYTSPALDAGQISRFGRMRLQGSLPAGTGLTVAVRSGNLQEPHDKLWSPWSAEQPATEFVAAAAPPARFFQYRLTFTSADGRATPAVDEVDVAWQAPNMAPSVKAVRMASAGGDVETPMQPPNMPPGAAPVARAMSQPPGGPHRDGQAPHVLTISWEAADPNGDPLEYALFFQAGTRGPWIPLAEKLTEPQFQWDTRGVADGRYRIRVVASDARANARGEGLTGSRLSDPVVVDNTPPAIGDIRTTVTGNTVRIEARIVDRTGIVALCEYAVDSKDDWQVVPSADSIWDAPEESVAFSIDALAPGPHQITLRASDDRGNHSYETVHVTIGRPAENRRD